MSDVMDLVEQAERDVVSLFEKRTAYKHAPFFPTEQQQPADNVGELLKKNRNLSLMKK